LELGSDPDSLFAHITSDHDIGHFDITHLQRAFFLGLLFFAFLLILGVLFGLLGLLFLSLFHLFFGLGSSEGFNNDKFAGRVFLHFLFGFVDEFKILQTLGHFFLKLFFFLISLFGSLFSQASYLIEAFPSKNVFVFDILLNLFVEGVIESFVGFDTKIVSLDCLL